MKCFVKATCKSKAFKQTFVENQVAEMIEISRKNN